MTVGTVPAPEMIRLQFELERDDNPRLYDELIRFNKGAKRVNRLRTLAQEGLLAEQWPLGTNVPVRSSRQAQSFDDLGNAELINQVFGQPIVD